MKKDTYHHGNLRNELIEKGLQYLDKHGEDSLSMRKLADSAGVSSAAPYAHFKNKEAYLQAVQEYVTLQFSDALTMAAEGCQDPSRILLEMGKAYVLFFYENPLYYKFLFTRGNVDVRQYQPFTFFERKVRDFFLHTLRMEFSEDVLRAKTYALWSMVHGLAQLVTMDDVIDEERVEEVVETILSSVSLT